jgi:hypothetical protein
MVYWLPYVIKFVLIYLIKAMVESEMELYLWTSLNIGYMDLGKFLDYKIIENFIIFNNKFSNKM